jgi:hypothetical protein
LFFIFGQDLISNKKVPPGPPIAVKKQVPPPPPTGNNNNNNNPIGGPGIPARGAPPPPPAAGGPSPPGHGASAAKGKGGPKRPKTDEEWLRDAITKVVFVCLRKYVCCVLTVCGEKVRAAIARETAAGNQQMVHDYTESLRMLEGFQTRLNNGDNACRQELAAIRASFR